jgi:hypothetical protein
MNGYIHISLGPLVKAGNLKLAGAVEKKKEQIGGYVGDEVANAEDRGHSKSVKATGEPGKVLASTNMVRYSKTEETQQNMLRTRLTRFKLLNTYMDCFQ